jgi:ketol-acid reductoisomerase
MATIYRETDVNPELIKSLKVAVLGYGSQGHAHALNLMDSGVEVKVALRRDSQSWVKAEHAGLAVVTVPDAAQWADVLMFCTPDVPMGQIYREGVADYLRPNQTLLFAHGFNIHYKLISPPPFVNVAMVAPKGPGKALRSLYLQGGGLFALVGVDQDPSGKAMEIALSYAWGIGCARSGMLLSTFKEETEADLFGEQAVLCGGISALVKAGFETLVEAGYQPEAAYFECLHETKLIVDLLYEGGLAYMFRSISDTAEWGAYVAGEQVVNEQSRIAMRSLLKNIQDGTFASNWINENTAGLATMTRIRAEQADHPVEAVGETLRAMMPFIKSK